MIVVQIEDDDPLRPDGGRGRDIDLPFEIPAFLRADSYLAAQAAGGGVDDDIETGGRQLAQLGGADAENGSQLLGFGRGADFGLRNLVLGKTGMTGFQTTF